MYNTHCIWAFTKLVRCLFVKVMRWSQFPFHLRLIEQPEFWNKELKPRPECKTIKVYNHRPTMKSARDYGSLVAIKWGYIKSFGRRTSIHTVLKILKFFKPKARQHNYTQPLLLPSVEAPLLRHRTSASKLISINFPFHSKLIWY